MVGVNGLATLEVTQQHYQKLHSMLQVLTSMLLTSSYELNTHSDFICLHAPLKGLSSPPLLIGCCRLMIQMVLLIDSCSTSPQKGVSTLMSWKSPYPKMCQRWWICNHACMHGNHSFCGVVTRWARVSWTERTTVQTEQYKRAHNKYIYMWLHNLT